MRFVKDGPDIPERLLKAHEEGDVVFFCGAGISYPAGLPGFEGLADRIFKNLHITPNKIEQLAIDARQFDRAIGLLEERIIDGRWLIRKNLESILKPNPDAKHATDIHENLLTLSKSRDGRTQLVTTNYDRLFEQIIDEKYPSIERFLAPLLPIPKKSQWNGLVYLHGLLTENPTLSDLDRLVVSSGDFGLAYLTERWAARFASELLRNYTICFIGYSIDDPILRYMMDAFAAARLRGEPSLEMFTFGSYSNGKKDSTTNEWRAKNVTPILYRIDNDHSNLRETLNEWAKIYHNRENGKKEIISKIVHENSLKVVDEFAIDRMRWVLSDPSGEPAWYFSEINPVPSIDWLRHLENMIDTSDQKGELDRVRWHLWCWLIRHLNDPRLLYYLAGQKNRLHPKFVWLFEYRMDELKNLKSNNKIPELERIRENSPKAIPCPRMQKFWCLLFSGRIRYREHDTEFDKIQMHRWYKKFKRDGLTLETRLNLLENLTPRICLVNSDKWSGDGEIDNFEPSIEWEIVLSVDHVCREIENLSGNQQWNDCLPDLLPEFTDLLQKSLVLIRELRNENDWDERSHSHQPSIDRHHQNTRFRDWEVLVDLTRDAWLVMAKGPPDRAAIEAKRWWSMPDPLFRRFALFAASYRTESHDFVIPARCALDWLLADKCRCLWSDITKREVMCLLGKLAPRLGKEMLVELEQAILAGPPSNAVRDSLQPEIRNSIEEQEICQRLKKIAESEVVLGGDAKKRLNDFSAKFKRQEAEIKDKQGENSSVVRLSHEEYEIISVPRNLFDMINWIKENSVRNHDQKDDWCQRCRDDFNMTSDALCELAKEDDWPSWRWQEALCAWSEEKLLQKSWSKMAPILVKAPTDLLQDVAHDMGKWLQLVAKEFKEHEEIFFSLINLILKLNHEDHTGSSNPVDCAINHPVEFVTDALIDWWHRGHPRDDQGLPKEVRFIFSDLCDRKIEKYRHGRILLVAQSVALFRADRKWAESYLLPLFNWNQSPHEARLIWKSFLHTPCFYQPLIESMKQNILDTASFYSDIDNVNRKYIKFFITACLDSRYIFTDNELRNCVDMLPSDGLNEIVLELVFILKKSEENREEYWTNQIEPYLRKIWPKDRNKITSTIANNLCSLCLASQERFPNALGLLRHWFIHTEEYSYLFRNHRESYLFEPNSDEALNFLIHITNDFTSSLLLNDINGCLNAIYKFDPNIKNDARYKKLETYIRKHESG